MMRSHCESQFPWPTALLQRRAIVDIVTPTTRATALACCCGHCPALLPCRLRPCRRRIAPRRCTSSRPRPLGQRSHPAISSSSLHAPCRRRLRPWPCPGHRRLRPPAICHFSGLAVIVGPRLNLAAAHCGTLCTAVSTPAAVLPVASLPPAANPPLFGHFHARFLPLQIDISYLRLFTLGLYPIPPTVSICGNGFEFLQTPMPGLRSINLL